MEGSECPLCLYPNQPKFDGAELRVHCSDTHPDALYFCSLCDNGAFASYADVAAHLTQDHEVEPAVIREEVSKKKGHFQTG